MRLSHVVLPMIVLTGALSFNAWSEELQVDTVDQTQVPVDQQTDNTEAIPADTPASTKDLAKGAADGEVSVPRVRIFNKPNRILLHSSVTNTKEGISFMDQNKSKPGVISLKDGLQYKVIKAGAGSKPNENDVVKCVYKGMLVDGTVFEESPAGKPANIKIQSLIPGLKEALLLMPVGAKWQVYIPSELGFGAKGNLPKVGPSAVVIYDLELRGIGAQ